MAHVFISYHKNSSRNYARKLADHLIANGFDVWIDDRINLGSHWEREIFKAIEICGAFIIIMTLDAYDSEWVQREYHYADRLKKRQFPVLLDGENFPFYSNVQYIDVRGEKIPPESFLGQLEASGVARKPTFGQDIANPPVSTRTITPPIGGSPVRRRLKRMFPFAGAGIVTLMVVISLIALSANNGGQLGVIQTETQAAFLLITPQPTTAPSTTPPPEASPVPASSTVNPALNAASPTLAAESRMLNTLLPTALNAQVAITNIVGANDISAEGIVLQNMGAIIDLTGWTLTDGEDNVYTFDSLRLFSSGQITLYTLPGLNTPTTIFWGLTHALWQTGDIVTLYDAEGNVQSSVRVP